MMNELSKILKENLEQVTNLCEQFGVQRLYAFGSVVSGNFDYEKSDLDFKVELEEMPPLDRGENLIKLWDALEDLFARKVDLITDQPIKNSILKANIEKSKVLIYDGGVLMSQKVFS